MKKITKITTVFVFALFSCGIALAQAADWGITDEQKAETLKVPFTTENQEAGQELFNKNCKICHNELSVAPKNTRQLPLSPNLGSQEIQKGNSDGELFYRITNGHIATGMPAFGQLLEEDRWKIITYLRTFYPDYQPMASTDLATAPAAEKFVGTIKGMKIWFDTASNTINSQLSAIDLEGNPTNAKNVKVNFYIKRRFGSLLIQTVKTDDKSMAKAVCPADIPADTNGFITLSAAVEDSMATAAIDVQFGEKLVYVNPLDKPEIWGTSAKAPLWIKLSYFITVIGVWIVIGWAAFQLFRIFNLRER